MTAATTTTGTKDRLNPAHGDPTVRSMAASLDELREQAGTLYRGAKERAIEGEHRLEDYVGQHPIKSVLLAAGLGAGFGLLAGILVARR